MDGKFYEVPYDKTIDTVVEDVRETPKGTEVLLKDTIFYPEGGGQPSDKGKLGTANVLYVHKDKGDIWHLLDTPLEIGAEVKGDLDWEWRFSNMQNHTAEHMVSGLVHKLYGYDNVGFHMDDDCVTVDFNGILDEEQVKDLERKANEAVWANLPVNVDFPSETELADLDYRSKKELKGEVRIVSVPNVDACACCGTHVRTTSEIGVIKILSSFKHRGGTRMTMVAGLRALQDYDKKSQEIAKLSELFSAKPHEVVKAAEHELEIAANLSNQYNMRTEQWLELIAKEAPQGEKVVLVLEDLTPANLKKLVQKLAENRPELKFAIAMSKTVQKVQPTLSYAMFSRDKDIRQVSSALNKALNGRGGGRDGYAQGSFGVDVEKAKDFIENFEA